MVCQIRMVWSAIGRGLFPSARSYEPRFGGKGFRDPIDRMFDHERRCWEEHYGPWSTWAGRQQVGGTKPRRRRA